MNFNDLLELMSHQSQRLPSLRGLVENNSIRLIYLPAAVVLILVGQSAELSSDEPAKSCGLKSSQY
ncbi:hypothetical protein PSI23_21185, partial [Xenorhabdus sp. XENO-10]